LGRAVNGKDGVASGFAEGVTKTGANKAAGTGNQNIHSSFKPNLKKGNSCFED